MNESHPACYRHTHTPTKLRCSECDKYICGECAVTAPVGQKCPECVKKAGTTRVVNARQGFGRPSFETAPVTMTLLAINVAVFVVRALSVELDNTLFMNFAAASWLIEGGQIHRVFTAMFLHAGIWHVGLNMYALYVLGPTLERSTKSGPFLMLYIGSGVVGTLVSLIIATGPFVAVGASGAIFGIFGAWFLQGYSTRHTPAGNAMFRQMTTLLLINAVIGVYVPQISWQAHLGGFIGGVLITYLWRQIPRGPNAARLRTMVGTAVGVAAIGAIWLL